jgi:hypothetical protein
MIKSSNVSESLCVWPMASQDLVAEVVDLALHGDFEVRSLKSKIKPPDARKERSDGLGL